MDIHEAVLVAMSMRKCIRRHGPPIWKKCKIEPTDSDEGCLIHSDYSKAPCPRWQPTAEDLMADDWMLVP